MKVPLILCATVAALFLAGCSTVTVTTDYDHEANFAAMKTFQWGTVQKDALSANATTSMFQNSLIEKRFKSSVSTQLKAKGINESQDNPDFLVMYHSGTQNKVNVTNYGYGYGRGWGGTGGVDVHQYTQGTIILDFVDAKTKQLVWRGTATGALSDRPDPAEAEAKLDGVVQQLLAEYPPAGK